MLSFADKMGAALQGQAKNLSLMICRDDHPCYLATAHYLILVFCCVVNLPAQESSL
jgi:hypothetical protein